MGVEPDVKVSAAHALEMVLAFMKTASEYFRNFN